LKCYIQTGQQIDRTKNCNLRAKGKGFAKKFYMKISGNLNHCGRSKVSSEGCNKCNVGPRNDEIVCNGGLKFKSTGPHAGHWLVNQQL